MITISCGTALRVMLETKTDFRIVGEAEDGLQALELLERLKPDVIVLDVMMPRLGGLEVARQASKRSPATRVVILSMYADEAYVIEALRAGAQAYVLKSCSPEEFVTAIKEAAVGHSYLSPPLSDLAIRAYISAAQASSSEDTGATHSQRTRGASPGSRGLHDNPDCRDPLH